jgi:16S rRNA U1498 N3-methylase RsmE
LKLYVEPASALSVMLAEPAAGTGSEPLGVLRGQPIPPDAAILIGSEGRLGGHRMDVGARARHIRLVTLGHRTLRADAVPVAAISVLQFLWGDLG